MSQIKPRLFEKVNDIRLSIDEQKEFDALHKAIYNSYKVKNDSEMMNILNKFQSK